jgi:hypothetical protein
MFKNILSATRSALLPIGMVILAFSTLAGRSRSFTASAGSMTLLMGFYDAVSGSLLARVMDAEAARDGG